MTAKNKIEKIKRQMQIKIFNIAKQDICPIVFAKYFYKNNFDFKFFY